MTPDEHATITADKQAEHARADLEARYVARGVCPDCDGQLRPVDAVSCECVECDGAWWL